MYDIIGDIHGHAKELRALLLKLGYRQQQGVFAHATRKAVYCGDFIDRGPQIPDVVSIVRDMVEGEHAFAVMGNHEFNALAFHTESPDQPGQWLRPHHDRNVAQHAATLDQFSDDDLKAALAWFRSLPVAIEFPDFRVVHACWSALEIQLINDARETQGSFSPAFLADATTVGSPLHDAIECVLKGPELTLPDGLTTADKEGNLRRRIRIRWFESPSNATWANYSLPRKTHLPTTIVPDDAPACPYPSTLSLIHI